MPNIFPEDIIRILYAMHKTYCILYIFTLLNELQTNNLCSVVLVGNPERCKSGGGWELDGWNQVWTKFRKHKHKQAHKVKHQLINTITTKGCMWTLGGLGRCGNGRKRIHFKTIVIVPWLDSRALQSVHTKRKHIESSFVCLHWRLTNFAYSHTYEGTRILTHITTWKHTTGVTSNRSSSYAIKCSHWKKGLTKTVRRWAKKDTQHVFTCNNNKKTLHKNNHHTQNSGFLLCVFIPVRTSFRLTIGRRRPTQIESTGLSDFRVGILDVQSLWSGSH